MAELSDEKYDVIVQRVTDTITDSQLQSELIDHCCCAAEELMDLGVECDEAIDQALLQLAPNGLHEIEVEFNDVLTPLIFKIMKITLYFSGFIAAFCILVGMMFKLMHWPGASATMLVGHLSLILCMLTILAGLLTSKAAVSRWSYVRILIGSIGGIVVACGSCFKIMSWPGANVLFVIGMFLVTFFFLPIFFWQLYQREIRTN